MARMVGRVRVLAFAFNLAILAGLAACGGKGPTGSTLPAAASEYAALRWVPADVSYAAVTRRADDAVQVLRDLADAFGPLDGEDASTIGPELAEDLGFDLLSSAAVEEQGIDLARGVAVWSSGVSPSFAFPLADPPRFAAMIERHRSSGAVVQVARVGQVEVYTWRPDREVALHWAIVDDWLLAHFEIGEEREVAGAWFDSAMAARGGFAASPDFAAARSRAGARVGGSPGVVAVVRVPALFASRFGGAMRSCRDTLGQLGRVSVAVSTDGKDTRGAVVAEMPGGTSGVRAMQLRRPSGWVAARGDAPLQVEVGLDARGWRPLWEACLGEDLEDPMSGRIFGGRAFAHQLDLDDMSVRGAASASGERDAFAELIDQIPAPDFLRKRRKVGAVEVTDLAIPTLPAVSFALVDDVAVVGVETRVDALVGPLEAPGDELARLEVRPQVWSEDVWNALLGQVIGRDRMRERTVRMLRRWSLGSIIASLDGDAIVIDLHGTR